MHSSYILKCPQQSSRCTKVVSMRASWNAWACVSRASLAEDLKSVDSNTLFLCVFQICLQEPTGDPTFVETWCRFLSANCCATNHCVWVWQLFRQLGLPWILANSATNKVKIGGQSQCCVAGAHQNLCPGYEAHNCDLFKPLKHTKVYAKPNTGPVTTRQDRAESAIPSVTQPRFELRLGDLCAVLQPAGIQSVLLSHGFKVNMH